MSLCKQFIFCLLLTLSLLFPRATLADNYYFNDEFNEELSNNTLDSSKWNFYPNQSSCPTLSNIKETAGFLNLTQCPNTPQFPYIISKTNPFPSGDFSISVKFQYTKVTPWGTGIAFVDKAPGNGEGFNNLFGIGLWQDKSLVNMRLSFAGNDVYATSINTNLHTVNIKKESSKYTFELDGQLVYTSPNTQSIPKAIWLGNPSYIPSLIPDWTTFKVDYIRVSKLNSAPEPFLDLPWDYQSQGLDFENIVYHPNSWFDHKYPLQNISCCIKDIIKYTGEQKEEFYKSHSGYDYGIKHGVIKNTPVLAAASGTAIFIPKEKSGGAGNMIKIDHGNGYQTWYEHLDNLELITQNETSGVPVSSGQKIGKVGLTGNTDGYHLHLSVFKDVNNNGNFNDDYPYGLIDPLGWEGSQPDPWELYGTGGAKSYQLFKSLSPPKTASIPSTGGSLDTGKATISFVEDTSDSDLTVNFKNGPFETFKNLSSVVPSFFLNAFNDLGQAITQFNKPVEITYNYSSADLSNIDEDSLKLYAFNPNTNQWEELVSILDKNSKTLLGQTTHFSQFALMGKVKDQIAPTTTAELIGEKGTDNWYRSNVLVKLNATDNPEGLGFDYTVYSLDGENWAEYNTPLTFTDEGNHKIYFLSRDKADNKEDQKSIEFTIDKTSPEAKISIDLDKFDLAIEGQDQNLDRVERKDNTLTRKENDAFYLISDLAGNTLKLDVRDWDKEKADKFKIFSTQYNNEPIKTQPDNHFNLNYTDKKEILNVKEQNFELNDETKINIKYDNKRNLSTIITGELEEIIKEVKPGLVLLQLQTNQGNLEYSY